MKKNISLLLTFLIILTVSTSCFAIKQINTDNTYFDINNAAYILTGNVYIETGDRIITADKAKVSMLSMEVWADGSIKLTQNDVTLTGDSVYASNAEKSATISGNVCLERSNLKITAETAIYNWQTKIAVFKNNVVVEKDGEAQVAMN